MPSFLEGSEPLRTKIGHACDAVEIGGSRHINYHPSKAAAKRSQLQERAGKQSFAFPTHLSRC